MRKDHVKEMQHARNEGGIDTKVRICSRCIIWPMVLDDRS